MSTYVYLISAISREGARVLPRTDGTGANDPELPLLSTKTLETKRFSPELKLTDEEGTFRAVIATLNVEDSDGDVTLPGFFGDQDNIPILVGHDWMKLPVGKGKIFEEKNKAILEGKLNLADPQAKSVYEWLKFDFENGSPAQDFSYGYTLKGDGWKPGEFRGNDVRFLQPTEEGKPGATVHEASLVLVGAGEGTGTQSVKSQEMKFADHVETVLAAVGEFAERARSLADLRAKSDRTLSDENLEKIRKLRDELDAIVSEHSPDPADDLPSEERFETLMAQTEARIAGRF